MDNQDSRNDQFDDVISYYLEEFGIRCSSEDSVVSPEDMAESGYIQISNAHIGQIGMMFQHLPGLATNAVSCHGTYRVYFDKSLGVLQQAKQGDGFLRANVVKAGTNNGLTGQALLKAASYGPLVANAVFSALSMVTGQRFLSEINGKLSQIDEKINAIQKFLENAKRSDLLARNSFLQDVIRTFEFIQTNDFQKQATINQLQRVRIECFSDLLLYSTFFNQKKEELANLVEEKSKKTEGKINEKINGIGDNFLLYKFALLTYSLSYYLEIMLSGNMDSRYIDFVKKDIKSKAEDYKNYVKVFSNEMEDFLNNAKAYKIGNFQKNLKKFFGASVSTLIFKNASLGLKIADDWNSNSEEKKKAARNDVINQVNAFLTQLRDYAPFTRLEEELDDYDRIVNKSQVELVYSEGSGYIKFSYKEDIQSIST